MKNRKLKIDDLKVSSFVTSMDKDGNAIKGGTATTIQIDLHLGATNPVMACDPRETLLVTNCGCSGIYPSLNVPCPTLDIEC